MRALVGHMQRRVFEVTCDWDDVEEIDLEPPALDRLSEVSVPVLVLVGGLDHDTVRDAAGRVVSGVAGARLVEWPQVGHLPSLERPADFADLLREWTAELARRRP
jgi:3-oxoadipate enol-lactonase